MALQSPCSGSRAKNRSSKLSSVLFPATAALALALPACGGETDSSGIATLVDATAISETVPESAEEETVSTTTSTSEISEAAKETRTTETTIKTAEDAATVDDLPAESDTQSGPVEPDQHDADAGLEQANEALSDEERLLRFADCMRSNGVDFPDPVIEADGTVRFGIRPGAVEPRDRSRDTNLPAAGEACANLLRGVTFGTASNSFETIELQDSLLEFARCMRDNGLDVGDPDLRHFGPGEGGDDGRSGGPVIQVWDLSGDGSNSPNSGPFGGLDFRDPDVAAALEECQTGQFGVGGPRSNS